MPPHPSCRTRGAACERASTRAAHPARAYPSSSLVRLTASRANRDFCRRLITRPSGLVAGLGGLLALLPATLIAATLDLTTATITDLQQAYAAGLPAERVVSAYLQRITAYDDAGPKLNAVLHLYPNALDQARTLDAERRAGKLRGPLHGVPLLIKDNFDTFDAPTTGGAIGFAGAVPAHDAFMVARLRAAGAILLAKTNLDEMARGGNGVSSLGGQTLNPHALDKIPGGSSAGTGASVAAAFAPAGLGTETGGSVRHPANDCNIVGLVATEGVLSRAGIMPISFGQDRGGPMALSVRDCAILLSVMAGIDPNDQITRLAIGRTPTAPYESFLGPDALRGKRLGVLRDLFKTGDEHAETNRLMDAALADLKKAGAILVDPVSTGTDLLAMQQATGLGTHEYKWAINAYYAARGPGQPFYTLTDLIASGKFHPRLKERYVESDAVGPMEQSAEYAGKYKNREALARLLEGLLERFALDAFVYPVRSGPLPPAGTWPLAPGVSGQSISDYCGLPAITVPAGFFADGTPQGIEFMSARFTDAQLLALAHGYEQAAPHRRLPASTPRLPSDVLTY